MCGGGTCINDRGPSLGICRGVLRFNADATGSSLVVLHWEGADDYEFRYPLPDFATGFWLTCEPIPSRVVRRPSSSSSSVSRARFVTAGPTDLKLGM